MPSCTYNDTDYYKKNDRLKNVYSIKIPNWFPSLKEHFTNCKCSKVEICRSTDGSITLLTASLWNNLQIIEIISASSKWRHLSAESLLLHACMTHVHVYNHMLLLNYTYSAPEHGYRTVQLSLFQVSACSRSRGKAPGYELKASVTYLNWIMHLRATARLYVHCHCIDNWPPK